MPPPVLDQVRVAELRGNATLQDAGRRVALVADTIIGENQPVQVGPKSSLRLSLGKRALFELGPNSRLVVHQLPRAGSNEQRATWLRLEQGYLRVLWSDARANAPIEVSFARWAAKLEPGESFFESRENAASACSSSGALHLSGVPEWTPQNLEDPCVNLEARRAPVAIALRDQDWTTLRTKRRLQPTLARAAATQATHAIARLEAENAARPARTVVPTLAFLPAAAATSEIPTPEYAAPAPDRKSVV